MDNGSIHFYRCQPDSVSEPDGAAHVRRHRITCQCKFEQEQEPRWLMGWLHRCPCRLKRRCQRGGPPVWVSPSQLPLNPFSATLRQIRLKFDPSASLSDGSSLNKLLMNRWLPPLRSNGAVAGYTSPNPVVGCARIRFRSTILSVLGVDPRCFPPPDPPPALGITVSETFMLVNRSS